MKKIFVFYLYLCVFLVNLIVLNGQVQFNVPVGDFLNPTSWSGPIQGVELFSILNGGTCNINQVGVDVTSITISNANSKVVATSSFQVDSLILSNGGKATITGAFFINDVVNVNGVGSLFDLTYKPTGTSNFKLIVANQGIASIQGISLEDQNISVLNSQITNSDLKIITIKTFNIGTTDLSSSTILFHVVNSGVFGSAGNQITFSGANKLLINSSTFDSFYSDLPSGNQLHLTDSVVKFTKPNALFSNATIKFSLSRVEFLASPFFHNTTITQYITNFTGYDAYFNSTSHLILDYCTVLELKNVTLYWGSVLNFRSSNVSLQSSTIKIISADLLVRDSSNVVVYNLQVDGNYLVRAILASNLNITQNFKHVGDPMASSTGSGVFAAGSSKIYIINVLNEVIVKLYYNENSLITIQNTNTSCLYQLNANNGAKIDFLNSTYKGKEDIATSNGSLTYTDCIVSSGILRLTGSKNTISKSSVTYGNAFITALSTFESTSSTINILKSTINTQSTLLFKESTVSLTLSAISNLTTFSINNSKLETYDSSLNISLDVNNSTLEFFNSALINFLYLNASSCDKILFQDSNNSQFYIYEIQDSNTYLWNIQNATFNNDVNLRNSILSISKSRAIFKLNLNVLSGGFFKMVESVVTILGQLSLGSETSIFKSVLVIQNSNSFDFNNGIVLDTSTLTVTSSGGLINLNATTSEIIFKNSTVTFRPFKLNNSNMLLEDGQFTSSSAVSSIDSNSQLTLKGSTLSTGFAIENFGILDISNSRISYLNTNGLLFVGNNVTVSGAFQCLGSNSQIQFEVINNVSPALTVTGDTFFDGTLVGRINKVFISNLTASNIVFSFPLVSFTNSLGNISDFIFYSVDSENGNLEVDIKQICDTVELGYEVGLLSLLVSNCSYPPPPNNQTSLCQGTPLCSNNGECTPLGCVCNPPWVGLDCLSKQIVINQPTANQTSPGTNIDYNGTLPDGNDVSFSSLIGLIQLKELTFNDSLVQKFDFTMWSFKNLTTSKFLYTTSIIKDNQTLETFINILVEWYPTATNITFAGESFTMAPSTIKYNIEISKYPFSSILNRLELVFSAEAQLSSTEAKICSNQEFTVPSSNSNFQYLKIQVNSHSLYGRFIKRAILDNRYVQIENQLLSNGKQNNAATVGIIIPSFNQLAILDPDFSVLINNKPVNSNTKGATCVDNSTSDDSSKKSLSKSQIAGIIIGSVGFAAVIAISATYYLVKKHQQKKFALKLSSVSK